MPESARLPVRRQLTNRSLHLPPGLAQPHGDSHPSHGKTACNFFQRNLIQLVQNQHSTMLQRNAIQDRQSQRKGLGGAGRFPWTAAAMSPHDPNREAEQAELKRLSPIEPRPASNQTKEDPVRQVLYFLWAGAEAPQRCEQVVELTIERLDEALHGQRVLS